MIGGAALIRNSVRRVRVEKLSAKPAPLLCVHEDGRSSSSHSAGVAHHLLRVCRHHAQPPNMPASPL